MKPPRQNPYRDQTLNQLYDALQRRAGDLLRREQRTADERAALAEDTALLLLAVAPAIEPRWNAGAPEGHISDVAGLAGPFVDWNAGLQRDVRYRVLYRAANAVHGSRGEAWLRDTAFDGERASTFGVQSDVALQRVLATLEAEWRARQR